MAEPIRPLRKFYYDNCEIAIWPFRDNEMWHNATIHSFYYDRKTGVRTETTQWNSTQLLALAHAATLASDWIREHPRITELLSGAGKPLVDHENASMYRSE